MEKSFRDIIAERYILLKEELLTESRVDYVKGQWEKKGISTEHDTFAKHKNVGDIVDHFANNADPTKKKIYTSWIVSRYNEGKTKQEDAERIHNTLSNFDKYKSKLDEKDINKYDSLQAVDSAVKPHIGTAATKAEKRAFENHEGQELKYDDDKISIYHLKTKEASQNLYGGGSAAGKTDWCTAARSENCMFDHYNKRGRLHVVHDKETGKVFQYHAHDAQFMDHEDNPISDEDFLRLAPSLHKAWEKDHSLVS